MRSSSVEPSSFSGSRGAHVKKPAQVQQPGSSDSDLGLDQVHRRILRGPHAAKRLPNDTGERGTVVFAEHARNG